jgi:hypothetical protein
MSKNRIWPVLLPLLLLLSACTSAEPIPPYSEPAPFSSDVSGGASSAASSAILTSSAPAVSSKSSEGSSSSARRPPSSAQSAASRLLASSEAPLTLNSSLPPTASPAAAADKPMPAVTAKMPAASGKQVFAQQGAEVDYSNASQGYIMAKYSGTSKIKILIYFNGGSSYYQYNLAGDGIYVTLPLQSGSGSYRVRFMENVTGSSYAELCSTEFNAAVSGSGCFVYPNQYVNYSLSSAAVAKAKSLCAKSASNAEKVAAIYQFIITTVKYDSAKASSVQSGYLPNVDSTLATKKGICFDYAALMAAMCRSQGIPVKLVIGNTSVGYHAWNEVFLGAWKRYDSTFAAAGQTAGTYTAEKYY